MCVSEFLIEEEVLSPVYSQQLNVFLGDMTDSYGREGATERDMPSDLENRSETTVAWLALAA